MKKLKILIIFFTSLFCLAPNPSNGGRVKGGNNKKNSMIESQGLGLETTQSLPPLFFKISSTPTPCRGNVQYFESTLACGDLKFSLTKKYYINNVGPGIKNLVDKKGFFGKCHFNDLIFFFGKTSIEIPKFLRTKIREYILNGPKEECLVKVNGLLYFTCHQLAMQFSKPKLVDFCYENNKVPYKFQKKKIKKDLSGLEIGDTVTFFKKRVFLEKLKSVHSAIFLGKIAGQSLFLSKIGDGPLSVNTIEDLYKIYPSAFHIMKWVRIKIYQYQKFPIR